MPVPVSSLKKKQRGSEKVGAFRVMVVVVLTRNAVAAAEGSTSVPAAHTGWRRETAALVLLPSLLRCGENRRGKGRRPQLLLTELPTPPPTSAKLHAEHLLRHSHEPPPSSKFLPWWFRLLMAVEEDEQGWRHEAASLFLLRSQRVCMAAFLYLRHCDNDGKLQTVNMYRRRRRDRDRRASSPVLPKTHDRARAAAAFTFDVLHVATAAAYSGGTRQWTTWRHSPKQQR
nr:hypothetical protein Iba_chr02eCG6960 [Ipomoea batatas]